MIKPRLRVTTLVALLTLIVVSTGTGFTVSAQVVATLDTSSVTENQTVTLTVRSTADTEAEPDFSVLTGQFELSSTSSQSSVTIMNGRMESSRSWSVVMMPKRVGTIDIPSISVGNFRTQPLRLVVQPLSAVERNRIDHAAFMETIVSHDAQYPQAAIYVTRRLLYSDAVRRIPSLPQEKALDVAGASVLPIGSRETTRQIRNNVNYVVMQWRYVIFAEKSGEIRIPGDAIRVGIRSTNRSINRMNNVVNVVAEEKVIKILPIPAEYPPDKPWFPASDVQLTQNYTPDNATEMTLGEAMTRTIELKAENSYESALVPLEMTGSAGLRIYPDQVNKESMIQGNEVWGTVSRTFNLLPIESGILNIPDFSVTWWDTVNSQVRTNVIKGREISVINPAGAVAPTQGQELQPVDATDANVPGLDATVPDVRWNYGLMAFAALGWLLALASFVIQLYRRRVQNSTKSPKKQPDYQSLRRAVDALNPVAIKQATVQLLADRLDTNAITARKVIYQSDEGRVLMQNLDAKAYGFDSVNLDTNYKSIKYLIDKIVDNELLNTESSELSMIFAK